LRAPKAKRPSRGTPREEKALTTPTRRSAGSLPAARAASRSRRRAAGSAGLAGPADASSARWMPVRPQARVCRRAG